MLRRLRALGGGGVVRLDLQAPVALLTLDHPERSNALSGTMLAGLAEAVDRLEAWEDGIGLILRGAGLRCFCAGADLGLVGAGLDTPELAEGMAELMHELTARLRGLPLISVAAIEGAAVGGGAELCTATDFRVMSSEAHIRFVHARLGLSPGWGGGGRLVEIVGRQGALRLLAGARRVNAWQAQDLGLVDRICPPGEAESTARQLLNRYERLPRPSVRAAKALVARPEDELAIFLDLWGGEEMRAAIRGGEG